MSHLLLYYQRPEPATWVFLSSFLLLGIYFVFHRFFSVRNLDLVLLLLLAPGLMMVYEGRRMQLAVDAPPLESQLLAELDDRRPRFVSTNLQRDDALEESQGAIEEDEGQSQAGGVFKDDQSLKQPNVPSPNGQLDLSEQLGGSSAYPQPPPKIGWSADQLEFYGFCALLIACGPLMIRMLIDPALVRRPLLTPNLSIGGLSFIGISLFLFLMANVITSSPSEQEQRGPKLGPGYALLNMLPAIPVMPDEADTDALPLDANESRPWLPNVARILAILSNLTIVLGIVGVGYWHFDNVKTGIGCAVMYLLLPYTAQMTGNLEHAMPAAMLVLALLTYRQPLISGVFLGLAAGLVYYPLFLLPLWISFYWHRGLGRLLIGIIASLMVLAGLLLLDGVDAFGERLTSMFGLWLPRMEGLQGIWAEGRIPADFRLPVLVGCILLSASFVFWPSRKNLGSLMCGTAAIMLAVQFWHGFGGGLFMAWFLPFTLLTMFRPNLDDRIALAIVKETVNGRRAIDAA